ncbi:MAG TPA: HAMP domain-containing sensor histidine kinase [Myxococcota bacterium]|nr:HAMP domain-containing sensor histidine kinase [Myxococcota bacterium]
MSGCGHSRSQRRMERMERRAERRRRRERDDEGDPRDALLSPAERALRDAERVATRRADEVGDLLKFSVVTVLLLIFLTPIGIVVLLFGGARHVKRAYRLWLEPRMREQYLQEEVDRRVHAHLSGERQALESEHAHSMQTLSARVAHEIRNPITAAKSLVQQMEEDPGAPENVEYARVALEELGRVERSVSHLLRFARDEEMRVSAVRLADVVDSALETFRDRVARSGIELVRETSGEGEIRGDAEKLRRVVINLVSNAIEAVDGGTAKGGHVAVGVGENLAGTEVWLRVADDGPGLDADALSKIWNPFYTSKPNGTGLGLPIVKKLVEAHGGSIEAAARPGGGAEFVAVFPKLRANEEAHA